MILLGCPSATSFLTASPPSKHVPLMILLKRRKTHTVNREAFPVKRCSSRPVTAGHSAHPVPLPFRHVQIFGDNLLKIVLFRVQLTCNHSNSQLMITTHHLPYPLDPDFSPACWRFPAPEVIFHLFTALFESLAPHKNTCTQYGAISIHLLKHFKQFKCVW